MNTCTLCGAEKFELNGVTLCYYCDMFKCVHCGHKAPAKYLVITPQGAQAITACVNCKKKHH